MPFLIETQKRPSLFPFVNCPLCDTPPELDLERIKNLYEIVDDSYIHLESSHRLQKHIATHLRDLSLLALLESQNDCVHSLSPTISDSRSRERDIDDVQDENKSNECSMDDSFDITIHNIPELEEEEKWDYMPSSISNILPEKDPKLLSFVERYTEENKAPGKSLALVRSSFVGSVRDVKLHPRILSLDGGGVRGLSCLLILRNIMEEVARRNGAVEARPCEYFDLIGGTGTGGLIAIMLGRLRMVRTPALCANTDSLSTSVSTNSSTYRGTFSR